MMEVSSIIVIIFITIHLSVWYRGQCVDPYEDGICGEEALGQRIFVGEDGDVKCDCDEVNILSLISPLTK